MSRFSRSSNPTLNPEVFTQHSYGSAANAMTFQGTINKIGFLFLLAFVAASFTWKMTYANPLSAKGIMMLGAIGGFIMALITCFSKQMPDLPPLFTLYLKVYFLEGFRPYLISFIKELFFRLCFLRFQH